MQPKLDKDSLLWKDFLNGSQPALSKVYLNNVNDMYGFGCKFTVDKSLVKDCIQDIFICIIQNRTKLSETKNVKGYLFKSLKRKIIRETVHKNKFEEIVERGDYRFEIEFVNLEQMEFENDKHSVKICAVRSAVKSLTSRQKEALYLRFYFGLSHKEISYILHLTDQSSRALVSRAINKMRTIIKSDKKQIFNILFVLFSKEHVL